MKTPEVIIKNFMDNNFTPMKNLPNNKMFYTDNSASSIVWVEDNVVIEHYFLFPNLETPLHSHPFENQMIFIFGDLTAYRKTPAQVDLSKYKPDTMYTREFKDSDYKFISSRMPIGFEHGFRVGNRGAIIYNIQIWPHENKNPLSAAIEYYGQTMGPMHDELINEYRNYTSNSRSEII